MGQEDPAVFTKEVPGLILPTQDYRRTQIVVPAKLHQGSDGVVHGIVGRYRRRSRLGQSLRDEAEKISEMAFQLRRVSDRILRSRLAGMQSRFRRQKKGREQFLADALACMVEVAERTLGLRPYPVQIMGAMALDQAYLTEMATGEGKTLTACLPAVLAAWTGRPCHIVTVNDYLGDRDANEMRPFYSFCGVSVACVTGQMSPDERRINYEKGVVYTTSKELVADFLRDRLLLGSLQHPTRRLIHQMLRPWSSGLNGVVMRGMDTAIVDEADSVLIDEAVTPLIISRAQENRLLMEAYQSGYRIAASLAPGIDYHTVLKYREIRLTDEALEKIQALSQSLPGMWRGASRRKELVEQALTAREFYHRDRHYVVQEDRVVIALRKTDDPFRDPAMRVKEFARIAHLRHEVNWCQILWPVDDPRFVGRHPVPLHTVEESTLSQHAIVVWRSG